MQNKRTLSERDICSMYISPAIKNAGWDIKKQVREEVSFTDGRIIVQGKMHTRGKRKRADYILYYKPNLPIAIIEAKDSNHQPGDGMQQAIDYAEILQIPKALKAKFTKQGAGGAQPNISRIKIRNMVAMLPPLEEQKVTVEKVHRLMALCDELEQQVQKSQQRSGKLMQAVIREGMEPEGMEMGGDFLMLIY